MEKYLNLKKISDVDYFLLSRKVEMVGSTLPSFSFSLCLSKSILELILQIYQAEKLTVDGSFFVIGEIEGRKIIFEAENVFNRSRLFKEFGLQTNLTLGFNELAKTYVDLINSESRFSGKPILWVNLLPLGSTLQFNIDGDLFPERKNVFYASFTKEGYKKKSYAGARIPFPLDAVFFVGNISEAPGHTRDRDIE
ncbi:MAG: hypothetical protein ACFFDI_30255, partial [Promethearchaeota archaeon]